MRNFNVCQGTQLAPVAAPMDACCEIDVETDVKSAKYQKGCFNRRSNKCMIRDRKMRYRSEGFTFSAHVYSTYSQASAFETSLLEGPSRLDTPHAFVRWKPRSACLLRLKSCAYYFKHFIGMCMHHILSLGEDMDLQHQYGPARSSKWR